MLRYCLGLSLEEQRRNGKTTSETRIRPIKDVMRKRRLERFGHVRHRVREEDLWGVVEIRVEGNKRHGQPKQRWRTRSMLIFAGLTWRNVIPTIGLDGKAW